jgi:glutamyl/glutaminyl-tRNA synthetase
MSRLPTTWFLSILAVAVSSAAPARHRLHPPPTECTTISARVIVGRLAPTASGHLHLGNALAFGAAWLAARQAGGRLLLRIEDLDRGRARPEVAEGQRADLLWLGIDWDQEVAPQSARRYSIEGIPVYRCACNRATRLARRCRCREEVAAPSAGAWRFRTPPGMVTFEDRACGTQHLTPDEDPILMTRSGAAAYPLAVVVDDARDGVTEVVRGADLLAATATQILLHRALGLVSPTYLHVPLLLGGDGKKLSKSHGATGIRALRAAGWTRERVWQLLLPLLGVPPLGSLAEARTRFEPGRWPPGPRMVTAP